jgi:hypothetical protein
VPSRLCTWQATLRAHPRAAAFPLVVAQGQVKPRSDACLGDCRAPTPELEHSKNFLKMCDAVHTSVAKHAVSVGCGRIAAVAGRDEQSGVSRVHRSHFGQPRDRANLSRGDIRSEALCYRGGSTAPRITAHPVYRCAWLKPFCRAHFHYWIQTRRGSR